MNSHNSLGLLTTKRQSRWLRGLLHRCGKGVQDRQVTETQHSNHVSNLESELQQQHESLLGQCRFERRQIFDQWDQSDEELISKYENFTTQIQRQKHHDLAALRRDRKHAIEEEESSFDKRKNELAQRYATEKPKSSALQSRNDETLRALLTAITSIVQKTDNLALQRLGKKQFTELTNDKSDIPVAKAEDANKSNADQPIDFSDRCEYLKDLYIQVNDHFTSLKSGWAVRFSESFFVIAVGVLAAVFWCFVIYQTNRQPLALWMLGSIPTGIIIAFAVQSIASIPVRRMTRSVYPQIVSLETNARLSYDEGLRANATLATQQLEKLRNQRDAALQTARDAHRSSMEDIIAHYKSGEESLLTQINAALKNAEEEFQKGFSANNRLMFSRAEEAAAQISERIRESENNNQERLDSLKTSHADELQRMQHRFDQGVRRAIERATKTGQAFSAQFPPWNESLETPTREYQPLVFLPLGTMRLPTSDEGTVSVSVPPLPLVIPRLEKSSVLIEAHPQHLQLAADLVRGALWRGLTTTRPGNLRLTLIDPVGHGENFASLAPLGDHDPQLIGHRVWSGTQQITQRLTELTHHVEDVLQTCLRDRYPTIEHYNREAMALAEPYHIVAAMGLPAGLSREGYDAIRALIDGGRRCGVFVVLVRDLSLPWPTELPPLPDANILRLRFNDQGRLLHTHPELEKMEIDPISSPPQSVAIRLGERIGREAINSKRVVIPLDQCVPKEAYDSGDSSEGLRIPVGRQGVGRNLEIDLGSGMRQHVLVAGKTGSGKSTLLHCLITAGALKYAPSQLHLYLLDFKKGVEFKVYSENALPHARVIGIESQREFGLSVLERLDQELQNRGELFRAATVQELSEYRKRTGEELPRILLVIDEFQELFTRDDRVAQECTMLLDRLVRQGRSFGMHVVLSSQSLSGAYTLPRATLGQMAVRIALQCSESDAAMILADDNAAARLLSRPGEAIFNDAGGLVEGNQPFQVAWLDLDTHRERLQDIRRRHENANVKYGPAVVFEGNRPVRWSRDLCDRILIPTVACENGKAPVNLPSRFYCTGLLGEAVKIGPPTMMSFTDNHGRNALCIGDPDAIFSVLATWLPTAIINSYRHSGTVPNVVVFDNEKSGNDAHSIGTWLQTIGIPCEIVRARNCEQRIIDLANSLEIDTPNEPENVESHSPVNKPITLVVINPLERFRDLRQVDSFRFSLDSADSLSGATALQRVLRDGPQAGIHTIVACGSLETLGRWLPRSSHHDLELRLISRISANDSSQLIDSVEASTLAPATMLLYDDANGNYEKFRIVGLPDFDEINSWVSQTLNSPPCP